MVTTETVAAAKGGEQRAASHNESGKNNAMMTSTAQASLGRRRMRTASPATQTIASRPSRTSRGGGRSRRAQQRPIRSGAMVMTPIASDTNQVRQIVSTGAGEAYSVT